MTSVPAWARPPLGGAALDRALAVLLTIGVELETWLGSGAAHERVPVAVAGALVTAAVAFRRSFPATTGIGAGFVAVVVATAWKPPSLVSWGVAWLCCLYALAVWATPRRFAFGLGAITLATAASAAAPGARPANALQFDAVVLVAMLLVRRVIGDRERRASLAERERDVAAREAVVEERARIARELHDAVAHSVSMMVVQAGAERRVLQGMDGTTRDVLETIERIGRDALVELRRLVGMLRSDAGDPLAPQPSLRDLPALAARARDAGLPVELEVAGEPRDLPVGVELSAYRIIQEALTNALKHAGGARATVSVRYARDSLELEILDDGPGGAATVAGGGHGLVGMRERVALYGGKLDVGRRVAGGFAVRVLLPLR